MEHKTCSKLNIVSILKLPWCKKAHPKTKQKNPAALFINLNWNRSSCIRQWNSVYFFLFTSMIIIHTLFHLLLCLHLWVVLSTVEKKEKNWSKIQDINKNSMLTILHANNYKSIAWYTTHTRTRNPYQMGSQEIKHCA